MTPSWVAEVPLMPLNVTLLILILDGDYSHWNTKEQRKKISLLNVTSQ